MSRIARVILSVGLIAAAGSCDVFGPEVGPPAFLQTTLITGTVPVGSTLDIGVRITDADNRPIPGQAVTWTPSQGGSVSADSSVTGEDGTAILAGVSLLLRAPPRHPLR